MQISVPRVPPSPNVLRRKYRDPKAYMALRQLWELEVFVNAPRGLPKDRSGGLVKKFLPPEGRPTVRVHQRRKRKLGDKENLMASLKPVMDALVNVGLLKDDSEKAINLKMPTQELCGRLRPSTVIEIEPEGKVNA